MSSIRPPGTGGAKRSSSASSRAFGRPSPALEVRFSEYPGHTVEIGREAVHAGYDRVICLGGDGTPYEFINGLYDRGRPARLPEIGQIPAGTGNSFLRDFDITTPEGALEAILSGRRRKVDLVEFTYREDRANAPTTRRYSLNIIGVGLIADILQLTNERLKFLGAAGYSLAVLIRLIRGMSNRITIEADGRKREVADSALVVSNSKFTGGKMKIAPPAETSDGRADIILFNGVNRRQIVGHLRRRLLRQASGPPEGRSEPGRRDLGRVRTAAPADGRRRAHRLDAPAPQGPAGRARLPGLTVRA